MILFPAIVLIIFPKYTIDDAYIYYRYADNFAKHGQLNWNVGEPPVEGYTGVALAIALSGFIKAGLSPVTMSHVIGIVSYFLGLLMLFLILRRLKIGTVGTISGLFLYCTIPILFTHALSGLDTMPFLGLYLTGAFLFLGVIEPSKFNQRLKEIIFFLVLLILSLTRPEGVALCGLFLAAAFYIKRAEDRKMLRQYVFGFIIFYLLPASVYFVWRYNYYGQLLPNTFYVKTNVGFSISNLLDLVRFLIRYFALPIGVCVVLFSAEMDLVWKKIKNKEFFHNNKFLVVFLSVNLIFVLLLILQFTHSHLSMNYAARFYVPILPLLWIVVALGIDYGWKAIRQMKDDNPLRYKFFIIFLIFATSYQFAFHLSKLKGEVKFAHDYKVLLDVEHISIGKTLKKIVPANEWLISYMDAGAVPYFSGLRTIDYGGLSDRFLANWKLTDVERVDYFYSVNPGAAVFTSNSMEKLDYGLEVERISSDPRFKSYILIKKYKIEDTESLERDNYEFLYLRKDIADKIANVDI